MIIFPRKIAKIGKCRAAIFTLNGPRKEIGAAAKGRPQVKYNGENWKVGRLSYHLNVKKISRTPKTLKRGIVCHHCDNAWCINPKHLYLGTAKQNTKDIYDRNPFIRERKSLAHRGNQNAKGSKRTPAQIRKISLARKGNQNAKGYKFTEEQRKYLSKALKGNQNAKGYRFTEEQKRRTRLGRLLAKRARNVKRKITA